MTANEKTLKALKSATNHLENLMLALDKKDESSFIDSLWHVAAELEYALFLFSVTFQGESDTSRWKPNPELKNVDTEQFLAEARNFLSEAETYLLNGKLMDAYKNAYIARHYIFKVQEDLAKKKREALKKK